MNRTAFVNLLKGTFREWSEDKAPRLAAALAYYSAFSIGPLVILAVGVASLIFGRQAAQGQVASEIKGTVGEPVAKALQEMLASGKESGQGLMAAVLGIAVLPLGG